MTEVGPAGHKRPGSRRSELERLIDRTVLGPTHPELGTCWQFTGTTPPYGRIAKAQDSYTHRLGWKLLRGPIPEGRELHHRCGIYACWNPDHLELVTHAENQQHLRKTHCRRRKSADRTERGCEPVGPATQRTNRRSGNANAPARALLVIPHSERYVNCSWECPPPLRALLLRNVASASAPPSASTRASLLTPGRYREPVRLRGRGLLPGRALID